ncbi:hypothetical protein Q604_UNBC04132G0001, partial [human gut metagenome]
PAVAALIGLAATATLAAMTVADNARSGRTFASAATSAITGYKEKAT